MLQVTVSAGLQYVGDISTHIGCFMPHGVTQITLPTSFYFVMDL